MPALSLHQSYQIVVNGPHGEIQGDAIQLLYDHLVVTALLFVLLMIVLYLVRRDLVGGHRRASQLRRLRKTGCMAVSGGRKQIFVPAFSALPTAPSPGYLPI